MQVHAIFNTIDTQNLTPGKMYALVGISQDSFRVLNDNEEPVIYPKNMFDEIDLVIPGDWIWQRYSEDEYCVNPPELASPGFFEDWFDHKSEALTVFDNYLLRVGIRKTR